ncbi:MAG: carbohydrate kinase [Actinobacteria bacterium]|nr:carbohydrate kinase [Actinomycetota bacterium]
MILVIGEALIDLIGEEGSGGNYTAVVGGANANVALALAVRGEQQRFLGRISSDGFGKQIRNHLSTQGVDLTLSVDAEEQTTLAVATIDSSGVASYSFYTKDTADWGWTAGELPSAEQVASLDTKAIQYGCLGMAIGPGNLVIEAWLKNFFEAGTVTLSHDLNIRPALGFERELELERVLRLNAQSHIIKASDADIEWLYGLDVGADLDDIASEWSKGKLVVITRGAEGVSLYRDGKRIDVAGQRVNLVDTVGAGDTFMANFLGELSHLDALGANPESRVARLGDEELVDAAKFANTAAAVVCERTGCQPPTKGEILVRLRGN